MELDENLFADNSELIYEKKSLYSLYYSQSHSVSVSYGILFKKIGPYLIHSKLTDSLGAPILNPENNKIIGIYIGKKFNYYDCPNQTIFLKYALYELNKIKNQINITVKVEKDDINHDIYFLNNTANNEQNLKELNKKM